METAYSKELKKYNSMTLEEFDKLPFTFVTHWSFSDCNISIGENKEYGIVRQTKTEKKVSPSSEESQKNSDTMANGTPRKGPSKTS
jgi:hypothetical protein